jgi:hypothetical protein
MAKHTIKVIVYTLLSDQADGEIVAQRVLVADTQPGPMTPAFFGLADHLDYDDMEGDEARSDGYTVDTSNPIEVEL